MPYIKKKHRNVVDGSIDQLVGWIETFKDDDCPQDKEGVLNYTITRLIHELYGKDLSYDELNKVMGVLSCAQQEFYRKVVAPYEDEKIKENGDV